MWIFDVIGAFIVMHALVSNVMCAEHLIQGLQPSNAAFYDPNRDFRCLDGTYVIPFSQVNDDYCDCPDGSDEPGTSACPNGSFYCTNRGYTPKVIPSNRVNDGICDCCDGEDEIGGRVQCANLCEQLGQLLKEEEARQHKLRMEGHEIYLQYVQEGNEARRSKQARLEELQHERDQVDMQRALLEKRKNEVEEPEKAAKEKHEQAWEADKDKRKAERRILKAQEAFYSIDENHDNFVSISEIQTHMEFDIDSNGEVSEDEAKEYLEENEEVTFDIFLEKIWDNIREIYRPPGTSLPPAESSAPPDTSDDKDLSDTVAHDESEQFHDDRDSEDGEPAYDDDEDDDDDDGELDDHHDDDHKQTKPSTEEKKDDDEDDKMPDYDDNTKFLIAAADEARREYNAIDNKFRDIENEINDLKKVLDQDLGPNNEYYPLMQKCFDFTDREYTYTLCPFDRSSQRGKNGGSETSLGRWGMWSGPSDFKYAVMKYENGQNCWNGPDRSAKVHIQCGTNNELVSVTEPNRCEYRFVFNTPAACSQPPEPFDAHTHTEL